MAKSENNEVMYGARGRVGNLVVFKNFGSNQTVIAKRPRRPDNPVYSEKQVLAKQKFREAVAYAKGVIENPMLTANIPALKLQRKQRIPLAIPS